MDDLNEPAIPRIPRQRRAVDVQADTATPAADVPDRFVIGEREYHVRDAVNEIWDRRIGGHVYRFGHLDQGDLRREKILIARRSLDGSRTEAIRTIRCREIVTRSILREAQRLDALHGDCEARYRDGAVRLISRLAAYARRYL